MFVLSSTTCPTEPSLSSFVVIKKDVEAETVAPPEGGSSSATVVNWVTGLDQVGRIHAYTICCSVKLPEGLWIKLLIAL